MASVPWDFDEAVFGNDPFRTGRSTSRDKIVRDLAAYELAKALGATEATRVAGEWVDSQWDALAAAANEREVFDLIRAFDDGVAWPLRQARLDAEAAAAAAQDQAVVDAVRARRAWASRYDPGAVSEEDDARFWCDNSALRRVLFHATRHGHVIATEGLKSRRETGISALGGGPDHVVSLTPDERSARRIAAALLALNDADDDPAGVLDWVRATWLPPVLAEVARTARGDTRANFERELRNVTEPQAQRVQIHTIMRYASMFFGATRPEFAMPIIIGARSHVSGAGIGYVRVYANVDTVINDNVGTITRGVGEGVEGRDRIRGTEIGCPDVRGGMRENRGAPTIGPLRFLQYAALAHGQENHAEANEIRACASDLTVTEFVPVADWRRVLDPS